MAVVACPQPILQFFDNAGNLARNGSVLTQVGSVNFPTYSDAAGTIPLPNPIPLNSRGEISVAGGPSAQLFLIANTVYTFTLFDSNGNLLNQAQYVSGSVMTASSIGQLIWPLTAAEAGVNVTNFTWPPYNVMRYANAIGNGVTNDQPAVQAAHTAAGAAGATVIYPPGYTFFCNADVIVPVAASVGGPIPCAQGPGWANDAVIFGSGSTFGFVILGTGATTGDIQGTTYNYAGSFRDMSITLTGTANSAFYVNSVNQPRLDNVWIRGSGTNGRGVYFLNCLLPVFKDCLVTGCGSATQYSVEFDTCTTSLWRGSRISGGVTTNGGLAIDRCTNFLGQGMSIESCGTPIVVSGKAESSLANTGITLQGLELENPGNNQQYILVGTGLTGSALVLDMLVDGWFGSPSGSTTVAYAIKLLNVSGFEARGGHFTLGASPIACFELANTNVTGVTIRPHRNLQSLGVPWVRYNGTQVLAAGPQKEWQLGLTQAGRPICTSKGLDAIYDGNNLTGATPSILVSSTMGGYFSSKVIANAAPTTVTSLSGGEPGMEIILLAADSNTTLTNGNSGGTFRLQGGSNLNISAGKAYKFYNDGANGTAGSCWVQL